MASSGTKLAVAGLNVFIMVLVLFTMVLGMYAGIDALLAVFADS